MLLTVKTVLLDGTVVEVDSLCPQHSVRLATIVREERNMNISIIVLVGTNV